MTVTSVTGSLTDHGVDCSDEATRIGYLANNRLDVVDSTNSMRYRKRCVDFLRRWLRDPAGNADRIHEGWWGWGARNLQYSTRLFGASR